MPSTTSDAVDRRRLRSERGRDAVVGALLAFYGEGTLRPGAADIARRAGVSERSVFRYFEDLEELAQAAIDRHWQQVGPAFAAPPATGDRATRIDALVEQRLRIHRVAGPVARAGTLLALQSPNVARGLARRQRALRAQITTLFATELRGHQDRVELVAAIDAATSLEQVEYLRVHAGLSAPRARAVMARTVDALLPGGAPDPSC